MFLARWLWGWWWTTATAETLLCFAGFIVKYPVDVTSPLGPISSERSEFLDFSGSFYVELASSLLERTLVDVPEALIFESFGLM